MTVITAYVLDNWSTWGNVQILLWPANRQVKDDCCTHFPVLVNSDIATILMTYSAVVDFLKLWLFWQK